jgi:hypothetical protein
MSLHSTDENSHAYCAVLKGEIPLTSSSSHTHVTSHLLSTRFLDICRAVDKDVEWNTEGVCCINIISILKNNVCFISDLIGHHNSCCYPGPFQLGGINIKCTFHPPSRQDQELQCRKYKNYNKRSE